MATLGIIDLILRVLWLIIRDSPWAVAGDYGRGGYGGLPAWAAS